MYLSQVRDSCFFIDLKLLFRYSKWMRLTRSGTSVALSCHTDSSLLFALRKSPQRARMKQFFDTKVSKLESSATSCFPTSRRWYDYVTPLTWDSNLFCSVLIKGLFFWRNQIKLERNMLFKGTSLKALLKKLGRDFNCCVKRRARGRSRAVFT